MEWHTKEMRERPAFSGAAARARTSSASRWPQRSMPSHVCSSTLASLLRTFARFNHQPHSRGSMRVAASRTRRTGDAVHACMRSADAPTSRHRGTWHGRICGGICSHMSHLWKRMSAASSGGSLLCACSHSSSQLLGPPARPLTNTTRCVGPLRSAAAALAAPSAAPAPPPAALGLNAARHRPAPGHRRARPLPGAAAAPLPLFGQAAGPPAALFMAVRLLAPGRAGVTLLSRSGSASAVWCSGAARGRQRVFGACKFHKQPDSSSQAIAL